MYSLIFPIFNEKESLPALYAKVSQLLDTWKPLEFEVVFVDDGSQDGTSLMLDKLCERDSRLRVVRFSRNFGSHAAIAAGLAYCKGQAAIMLSSDLQTPADIVPRLLQEYENGAKIVWGVRAEDSTDPQSKSLFSKAYYRIINATTPVAMPSTGVGLFLVDRDVIEAFRTMPEKHSSVFMALSWLGFPQASVEYQQMPRQGGRSKWTFWKKVKLLLDSVLSFSYVPIRLMSAVGFCTAALGFLYALVVVVNYLLNPAAVQGWSTLMVAVLLIGGVQMLMLGLLGEYLWRTFDEARLRPRFVVHYTRGFTKADS